MPLELYVEVVEGLADFASAELSALGLRILQKQPEHLLINCSLKALPRLSGLRRAVAVYLPRSYPVPRPKALLGDEYLRQLLKDIDFVRTHSLGGSFSSFRFAAAGSDSSVFQRLAATIETRTKLNYDAKEGDLLLRIRPLGQGWQVLSRLSPRPLSSRAYRQCNLPGGLNATVAVAMNDLAHTLPQERYLNAMCGSGTLLIEQLLSLKPAQALGVDLSQSALNCAQENLKSARLKASLMQADVRNLPFAESSFDVISMNPPWGDAVGSLRDNRQLYPAALQELARIASPSARLVVLTHDIRHFEDLVPKTAWQLRKSIRVSHSGHYPRLYMLTR